MARKCYYIFSACACLDRRNVSHEVVKRFNLVHQLVQLVYDLLDVRNKSKSVVLHFHLHFFNIVLLGSGCHLPLVLLLRILLHFFFSSSPPLSQTRNGHVWKWKIVFPLAKSSSRWERLNSHMPNELLLLLRLVFLAPLQLVHYISMNIAMDGSHKWHKVCFSSTRGVEPSPDDSQTFNVDCLWFQVGWLLLHSFSLLGKWLIFFPCNYDFFFKFIWLWILIRYLDMVAGINQSPKPHHYESFCYTIRREMLSHPKHRSSFVTASTNCKLSPRGFRIIVNRPCTVAPARCTRYAAAAAAAAQLIGTAKPSCD